MEVWFTVGKPVSVRGTATHTTLVGKLIPEVNSLILYVVHLDFMLVKHGAVLPPYRSENTAFPPYLHIPCVSIHKNSPRDTQASICFSIGLTFTSEVPWTGSE